MPWTPPPHPLPHCTALRSVQQKNLDWMVISVSVLDYMAQYLEETRTILIHKKILEIEFLALVSDTRFNEYTQDVHCLLASAKLIRESITFVFLFAQSLKMDVSGFRLFTDNRKLFSFCSGILATKTKCTFSFLPMHPWHE